MKPFSPLLDLLFKIQQSSMIEQLLSSTHWNSSLWNRRYLTSFSKFLIFFFASWNSYLYSAELLIKSLWIFTAGRRKILQWKKIRETFLFCLYLLIEVTPCRRFNFFGFVSYTCVLKFPHIWRKLKSMIFLALWETAKFSLRMNALQTQIQFCTQGNVCV